MIDEYPVCPVCGSNSGQGCTADCTAIEITKLRAEVERIKNDPAFVEYKGINCLLYTSPSPRDRG